MAEKEPGPSVLSTVEVALVLAAAGVALVVSGHWMAVPLTLLLAGGPVLLLALRRGGRSGRGGRAG